MDFNVILSLIAAIFTAGIVAAVLCKDRHSFVHRIFSSGMVLFSLEALSGGLILQFLSLEDIIQWYRWRFILSSLLPGIWLVFSMSFARGDDRQFLGRWFLLVLSSFLVPLLLTTIFRKNLFIGEPIVVSSSILVIRLGWSGYLFNLSCLLILVSTLMNLERTLRSSAGLRRREIKYLIFGLGSVLTLRFYMGSFCLLFRSFIPNHEIIYAGGLIVGGILMIPSLLRMRILNIDIYPSRSLLYGSFTVLIAGIYLLSVGAIARVISYFNKGESIYFKIFYLFLAFIGFCILLFSDRVRVKTKRFITLHLRRPHYDYRKVWESFTQVTAHLTEVRSLCNVVAKFISETFEMLSVTVWIYDQAKDRLIMAGSTAFSRDEDKILQTLLPERPKELILWIKEQEGPIDIEDRKVKGARVIKETQPEFFENMKIRWLAPLRTGENLLGFIGLHGRISSVPFSVEELNLLKTISNQVARSLFSLQLFEELERVKETEAFQTMATFVVHDLKNLASTLSLTLTNLSIHFDNPEFRKDAVGLISKGVAKIRKMCSELSLLSQKFEIRPLEVDLNELIEKALSSPNGIGPLKKDFQLARKLYLDPEQMEKVIINLVLNAKEATRGEEAIEIQTAQNGSWALFSVRDHGCGMTEEFVENSLFRPFKTTKKQGMGIGLFHSKRIVEAHGGRIEVESEENVGTTFRVFLPLK